MVQQPLCLKQFPNRTKRRKKKRQWTASGSITLHRLPSWTSYSLALANCFSGKCLAYSPFLLPT
jgi:hypothetical protein